MKRGPAGDFSDPSGDLLVIALSLCIGKQSFLVFPVVCPESSFAFSQADKIELASQTRPAQRRGTTAPGRTPGTLTPHRTVS